MATRRKRWWNHWQPVCIVQQLCTQVNFSLSYTCTVFTRNTFMFWWPSMHLPEKILPCVIVLTVHFSKIPVFSGSKYYKQTTEKFIISFTKAFLRKSLHCTWTVTNLANILWKMCFIFYWFLLFLAHAIF